MSVRPRGWGSSRVEFVCPGLLAKEHGGYWVSEPWVEWRGLEAQVTLPRPYGPSVQWGLIP